MNDTVFVFTRNGMGEGPVELQLTLVKKFLSLTVDSGEIPSKIVFYTDGVRLVNAGSPVIDLLKQLVEGGTELVLCKTYLDYFHLLETVETGVVGGMPDIVEALNRAQKVVCL